MSPNMMETYSVSHKNVSKEISSQISFLLIKILGMSTAKEKHINNTIKLRILFNVNDIKYLNLSMLFSKYNTIILPPPPSLKSKRFYYVYQKFILSEFHKNYMKRVYLLTKKKKRTAFLSYSKM